MSRTDAHTPYRVRVGEPHHSNQEPRPKYGTVEYVQWWQSRAELPWHELVKCWGRQGDWDHHKTEIRKERYNARSEISRELEEMWEEA